MLKLGTQNIAALHLGGAGIQKAYLGETVVFGAGKPSRLPDGYTEVEYIQSSGGACIDSGYKPAITLKIAMDVQPLEENTSSSYGADFISSFGGQVGSYWYTNTVKWLKGIQGFMGRATSVVCKFISTDGTPRRVNIEMNWPDKKISVDESSVVFPTNSVSTTLNNLVLLRPGKYGNANYYLNARLYSCQMSRSDTGDVRDFVPCINPTGAVGLYDLVEGKFYGNAGTGAFTAGPAV